MTTVEIRYAFVVGTGRCGSTLLHDLIARHPDVGFISNADDHLPLPGGLGRLNKVIYERIPETMRREGRRVRFAPSEAYIALESEVGADIVFPCGPLRDGDVSDDVVERFRTFFERRARAQRRPVFVHKLTGWPRVGLIRRAFPDARFIHIVRDGRAVANSLVRVRWWQRASGTYLPGLETTDVVDWVSGGRSPLVLAGLTWAAMVDAYDREGRGLDPERWFEMRYEDLLASPWTMVGRILDHLGLERARAFDAHIARYRFDQMREDAFRRDLDASTLGQLEQPIVERLARYGYLADDGAVA